MMTAIGLMSGTSMDGIDVALVTTDGENAVSCGPSLMVAYEPAFRRRLEAALEEAKVLEAREGRPGILFDVERELTDRHAGAVQRLLFENGLLPGDIDVIGFHGQTVLHRPTRRLTVQLGDGQRLADLTGVAVVYDMRANDMIHGGQGAPLVPAYHRALAASLGQDMRAAGPVAFVNVGGISNATFIDGDAEPVAFDCGPGNALIDQWVQQAAGIPYDDAGAIASEGKVDEAVVSSYLAHPFFAIGGPKSLDRNDFTLDSARGLELADGAATLARVTARAILVSAAALPKPPATVIVCGGGRRNAAIMRELSSDLHRTGQDEHPGMAQDRMTGRNRKHGPAAGERPPSVIAAEQAGFDGDAMEAQAWAYLAVRSLKGLALTWPSTTGCDAPATGGVLVRPVSR